ncbi:MAG: alpha/beta hydrolase [Actinomycetota bacterium]|nr:alpha/beta hydrolase [Actinomycetota bacterium]
MQSEDSRSGTDYDQIVRPSFVRDGFAVYAFGSGEPVLLMPYPHAATGRTLMELVEGLETLGRRVITFDPPGSGRSMRTMRLDMGEMLGCAEEALAACGLEDAPVDVMGHSQGGFAALAFAIERAERVRRLVVVGAGAGGPSWMRAQGAIWNRSHPDFWRFGFFSSLYFISRRLAAQKMMFNLIFRDSYVDQEKFVPDPVSPLDWLRPAHPRTRWALVARRLDYSRRLGEVSAPTLVLVGRQDPQMPPPCSEELAGGIPNARLVVFEKSGHYPYTEEPEQFWAEVRNVFGVP